MTAGLKTGIIISFGALLVMGAVLAHRDGAAAANPAPAATVVPVVTAALAPMALLVPAPAPGAFADASKLPASASLKAQAALSHPALAFGQSQEIYFQALVSADAHGEGARIPLQLALVLDCSGSMEGAKIEGVKQAARKLIEKLGDGDRLAVITYESSARVLMPSTAITTWSRAEASRRIEALTAGGSTNLAGGVECAERTLFADREADHATRRMVLLSDGQANVGEIRNQALFAKAAALRERGVGLSAVGVGRDFSEQVMEGLAEHGGGRFRFLDDPAQIAAAFMKELRLAARLVASNVDVVLKPGDGTTIEEVYGLVSKRVGDEVVVHLPDIGPTTQARVVARLRVDARTTQPVLQWVATFTDVVADHGRSKLTPEALSVRLAASPQEAASAIDSEVLAQGLNSRGIADARRAMDLYNTGHRQEAVKALDSTMGAVASANTNLKSKSLAESLDIFGSLRGVFANPSNTADSPDVVTARRKSISNFGTNVTGSE
jgi:Ca-activated chloride channel family protein